MDQSSLEFGAAFNAAPRPIRSYIIDGKLDEAIKVITQAHSLHIDVEGVLQHCATSMLVGSMSPTQVQEGLIQAGVDAETSKVILEELNQKVFLPVREKMQHFKETGEDLISPVEDEEDNLTPVPNSESRKQEAAPPSISRTLSPPPATILTTEPSLVVPIASGLSAVSASPKPAERHINKLEVAPVPVPSVPMAPPAVKPMPEVKPIPSSIPAPKPVSIPEKGSGQGEQPQMRTMAADMEAVKEHRAPSAFFTHGAPVIAVPPRLPVMPSGPGSTNTAPPKPAPVLPPVPTAPTNPVVAAVSEKMPPPPIARTAPPPPNLPGTPLIKEYGTDPYREAPE